MNISQLQFVEALASERSFTEAAAKCHVTQPTLSNGIRKLEEELGGRLFNRTTRQVKLTPLGEHLMPYVAEVLNAHRMFKGQAVAFQNPTRHVIRIGASPLINSRLVGLMLEPFHRAHPDCEFVLREMNMADLYRMLDAGLLDYVFGVEGSHRTNWISAPLYQEPLLYIPPGPTHHSGSAKAHVHFDEIAHDTFLMVPDTCGLACSVRALFRQHRKQLHEYGGEAMGYHILEEWAALNIGSAILPKSKIRQAEGYPILDKSGGAVRIAFEAVWLGEGDRAGYLNLFEKHLQEVVPRIIQGIS